MFGKNVGKKILLMAAAAMLAVGIAGCGGGDKAAENKPAADGGKLVIAINSTFPPFESVKEGTSDYTGIDIDIAQYMAKKMGKTAEFTDMKFASLVPTLQSGRAADEGTYGSGGFFHSVLFPHEGHHLSEGGWL